MNRYRNAFVNLALVCGSVLFVLLLGELVVFRFILLPSDVPRNAYLDGLIRYVPNQTGIYRVRDEIAARFSINQQGWNSAIPSYAAGKDPTRRRIAIIGDSYVEALQVPYDRSLAASFKDRMADASRPVEVYRFAISGAPLSHYLYMLEHEVVRDAPDVVVIVLVHNDFDESIQATSGRYVSSFMRVGLKDGVVDHEIAPSPYRETWRDWVRQLATVRYLYYRQQVSPIALRRLIFPEARAAAERFEANIDVERVLSRRSEITAAVDYIFGRIETLSAENGFDVLLVMDANRTALYQGRKASDGGASELNILARTLAARHGLAFLDLTDAFTQDWRAHRAHFEFASDGHWNERGHRLAGDEIARVLLQTER